MAGIPSAAAMAGPPPSQPLAHRNRQGQIVPLAWPPPHLRGQLQPDDANDSLLMLICGALAAVSNRALCPKEIAEICMARGWTCSGSQPFAIVSSSIRAHLRRRGIGTANASNGQPAAPGLPPPLFTSYELSGPVTDEDALAMGIDAHAKPAVKRGVLWFLSEVGTGYPSPFGARHAELASQQAERIRKRQIEADIARAQVEEAQAAAQAAALEHVRGARTYGMGPDGLGRGKRKRFASSIAGGDPEWDAGAANALALTSKPRSASEEADVAVRPRSNSDTRSSGSAVTATNGRRIKIRLGSMETSRPAPSPPVASTSAAPRLSAIPPAMHRAIAHDGSSATEDDDEDEEAMEARLMLARRKKLRTRSESSAGGRPALFGGSRLSLSTVPSFRIGSRSTSVHEEDGDEDMLDLDDAASVPSPPAAPASTPTTSVPGPMGAFTAEFEYEFSFAFNRGEIEGDDLASPVDELNVDLLPLRLDEVDVDTPATTPRSSADDDEPATVDGKPCEQLKATAEAESTLCPARPAEPRARSRSATGAPVRAMSEGPMESSSRPHFSSARSEGDLSDLHDPLVGTVFTSHSTHVGIDPPSANATATARTLGFAPAHPHSTLPMDGQVESAMDLDEGDASTAELLLDDHHSGHAGPFVMAPLRSAVVAPPNLPRVVSGSDLDMLSELDVVDFGSPRSSIDDEDDETPRHVAEQLAPEEVTLHELELAFGGEGHGRSGGVALTAEALEAVALLSAASPPPFMAVELVAEMPIEEEDVEEEPAVSIPSPPRTRSRVKKTTAVSTRSSRKPAKKVVPAVVARSPSPEVERVPPTPVTSSPVRTRRSGRRSAAAA